MKCNHHESCYRSKSAPSEDRPYTSHTGTNPWLSHLYESYFENVKELEREREKEKERLKGTNKERKRKCNHHVTCDTSESALLEDRPYTCRTGTSHWQPPLDASGCSAGAGRKSCRRPWGSRSTLC